MTKLNQCKYDSNNKKEHVKLTISALLVPLTILFDTIYLAPTFILLYTTSLYNNKALCVLCCWVSPKKNHLKHHGNSSSESLESQSAINISLRSKLMNIIHKIYYILIMLTSLTSAYRKTSCLTPYSTSPHSLEVAPRCIRQQY